jgi:hypothetical protein
MVALNDTAKIGATEEWIRKERGEEDIQKDVVGEERDGRHGLKTDDARLSTVGIGWLEITDARNEH